MIDHHPALIGLDPELIECAYQDPYLGLCIQNRFAIGRGLDHLYMADPVTYRKVIEGTNALFRRNMEVAKTAFEQCKWDEYIDAHERPYQPDALFEAIEHDGVTDLWPKIRGVWQFVKHEIVDRETWLSVWSEDCPFKHKAMTKYERAYLRNLPDEIRVYRGVGGLDDWEGIAWTLRKGVACWFAHRNASRGEPVLIAGTIRKADVFAFLSDMGEREILCDPAEVRNLRFEVADKIGDRPQKFGR